MASGLSPKGRVGRCFYDYQDFTICLKTTEGKEERTEKCGPVLMDYMECLHGHKALRRKMAIDAEERRQIEAAKNGGGHSKVHGHGH